MENSPQKTSVKLKFEKIMEKIPTNTELEQIINEQGPLSSIALIELQERRKEQAMQQRPVQGTVAQRVVDDMNARKQAQMMGIAQMQPQINPDEISPEMINALGNPNVLRASDGAFIGEGTPQGFDQELEEPETDFFLNPFREDFLTDLGVGVKSVATNPLTYIGAATPFGVARLAGLGSKIPGIKSAASRFVPDFAKKGFDATKGYFTTSRKYTKKDINSFQSKYDEISKSITKKELDAFKNKKLGTDSKGNKITFQGPDDEARRILTDRKLGSMWFKGDKDVRGIFKGDSISTKRSGKGIKGRISDEEAGQQLRNIIQGGARPGRKKIRKGRAAIATSFPAFGLAALMDDGSNLAALEEAGTPPPDPSKEEPPKEGGEEGKGLGLGLNTSLNPLLTILAGDAIRRGDTASAQGLLKTGQAIQQSKDARALDREKLDIAREELQIKRLAADRVNQLDPNQFLTQRLKFNSNPEQLVIAEKQAIRDVQINHPNRSGLLFKSPPTEVEIRKDPDLSEEFNRQIQINLDNNFTNSVLASYDPSSFMIKNQIANQFKNFSVK